MKVMGGLMVCLSVVMLQVNMWLYPPTTFCNVMQHCIPIFVPVSLCASLTCQSSNTCLVSATMAVDCKTTDFEWIDPIAHSLLVEEVTSAESSHFLKEGYLHVMEKQSYRGTEAVSTLSRAMKRVRSLSDLESWSRRWCVLSQTLDGLHFLLYKDQSSFSNLQMPCAVLPLDNCLKLSSLPSHSKSENTFALTLQNRDILCYADKSIESEEWLKVLEDVLQLQDAYCHSPLKGLPQQKAMRKDSQQGAQPLTRHKPLPSDISGRSKGKRSLSTGAKPVGGINSVAVSKGILAMSSPHVDSPESTNHPDYQSPVRKRESFKRGKSSSLSRKNIEDSPVQVLHIKRLDT